MRLLRLLKLLKLDVYIEQMEDVLDMNLRFVQVLIMLLKVGFLSHILGCFWYGVGASSRQASRTTWYLHYAGDDEAELDIGQLYLWSIYWAVFAPGRIPGM